MVSVFFHPDATNEDILRSILHAALVRNTLLDGKPCLERPIDPQECSSLVASASPSLRSILADTREGARRDFPAFKRALEDRGWRTDELCFADLGHRVTWTT